MWSATEWQNVTPSPNQDNYRNTVVIKVWSSVTEGKTESLSGLSSAFSPQEGRGRSAPGLSSERLYTSVTGAIQII